jgi:hypothetical protein
VPGSEIPMAYLSGLSIPLRLAAAVMGCQSHFLSAVRDGRGQASRLA